MKRKIITAIAVLLLCVFAVTAVGVGTFAAETESENAVADISELTDGGENEAAKSLWSQFWNALFDAFSGTNARDSVVTVCSILAAVVAVLLKNVIGKVSDGISGFTAANGTKINELIDGVNENAAGILELSERLRDERLATEKVSADEAEKNALIEKTNAAVAALADMIMTTYSSSSTIPDAAKEVIRAKYVDVIKATGGSALTDNEAQ